MGLKDQLVETSKDHLGSLETRLNGLLKPVSPRPEFVDNLRHRIQITGQPAWVSRFSNMQFVVILIAGVISSVVLVTMLARVLVNLLTLGRSSSRTS